MENKTITELKSLAYDHLVQLERLNVSLRNINSLIEKKMNPETNPTVASEVTPEVVVEATPEVAPEAAVEAIPATE